MVCISQTLIINNDYSEMKAKYVFHSMKKKKKLNRSYKPVDI